MATVPMDLPNPPNTIARLSYFVEPKSGERAFQHINANPATGERERNFTRAYHDVVVKNLRGEEESVTLDNAGFQFHRHSAKHTSFSNDTETEKEYYPETIELLKKLTGASKVVIFDHSMIIFPPLSKRIFSNHIFEIQPFVATAQENLTTLQTAVNRLRKFTLIKQLNPQWPEFTDISLPLKFPNFSNVDFRSSISGGPLAIQHLIGRWDYAITEA